MRAPQEDEIAQTEPSAYGADEETPLLVDESLVTTKDYSDNDEAEDEDREQTIIADEPSNKRLAIVLGTIWIGVFLGALDSTIIATLSAPISTSFNSLSMLSWLASAYLIANAACQPISGRLTDIFSRRSGLVVSNILFGAGNLMCGLATSEWTMIAGRVVAGMGGGGLMAITTFVCSDLVPLRKRGMIQGIGNVLYGAGAGVGGVFGGWMNETWGWRTAFIAQVPLILISAVMVYIYVDVPPKQSKKSKISRVDFPGALTLVISLILLLLGLNSGGNVVPWTHPLVLVTLPLSVVVLVAFVWIEASWAKEPVIPVKLLLIRTVGAACLTNWFTIMGIFSRLFIFSFTRMGAIFRQHEQRLVCDLHRYNAITD
jgi:MFS family permease